ncbi:MAG TPA: YbaB/EbfC family nucleoid-associated protein [Patescibacteria group bacterium]|nr:YbaB/EbfC family nucleoid-associated protein [Patescibacteria group bacterium]
MAKRSFRGKPKKAKAPSTAGLMGQMQQMQEQMAEQQEALADESVTVTAGGGAITIVITGHQRLESIEIQPELVDPEEIDLLQDLLVAAVNAAIEQSQAMAAQRMEGLTGGLNLNDILSSLGGA